jgi:hypothetical protein
MHLSTSIPRRARSCILNCAYLVCSSPFGDMHARTHTAISRTYMYARIYARLTAAPRSSLAEYHEVCSPPRLALRWLNIMKYVAD